VILGIEKKIALTFIFLAVCLFNGCTESSSPPKSSNDNSAPLPMTQEEGGSGGGTSTKTCVVTGAPSLQPYALYEVSYDIPQEGGGGYTVTFQLRANVSGEISIPNVPINFDCNQITATYIGPPEQPPSE